MNPRDPRPYRSSAYPYTTGAARERLAAARMQARQAARRRAMIKSLAYLICALVVIIVCVLAVWYVGYSPHCTRTYTQGNTTITRHCGFHR